MLFIHEYDYAMDNEWDEGLIMIINDMIGDSDNEWEWYDDVYTRIMMIKWEWYESCMIMLF